MKNTLTKIFIFCLTIGATAAQNNAEKEFLKLVKANSYSVQEANDHTYHGTGIDWLIEEGTKSQYFLIGETHGTAEIPQISASIFIGLSKNGYKHAAFEISPFAANRAEQLIQKGGYGILEDYLSSPLGYNSSSFLGWREEAQLASLVVELSTLKAGAIWGLDQEFILGFGSYLDFLMTHAENSEQKDAIENMQLKLKSNEMLFINFDVDTLKSFTRLFKNHSNQEVRNLVQGLDESHYIYGSWASPARISLAESNVVRENLMKRNFLAYNKKYSTEALAKVFFKFGGFHSAPMIDKSNGTITFGTFIEEFSLINEVKAFNLLIECYGGTKNLSGQDEEGTGDGKNCESAYGTVNSEKYFNEDGVHPFNNFLGASDKIFLIDLRPIRLRMNEFEFLSDHVRTLISGFDAYMALPIVTQSKTLSLKK